MTTTPLFLLTGFLGSGKTTLLNRLLHDPQAEETAVLINEFGEIGVDHLLLESVEDDIVLLESGCVCCSVRDDFSRALLDLHRKREIGRIPAFRQAVLETTGIADPASIAQLLLSDGELRKRYGLAGIVTVVDAHCGLVTLEHHVESVQQAALADRIVLSKLDIADPGEVDRLRQRLDSINPCSPRIPGATARVAEVLVESGLSAPLQGQALLNTTPAHASLQCHQQRYSTFALSWSAPVNWDDFVEWLDALLYARGEDILRLKGVLHTREHDYPLVVQGVQHSVFEPTGLKSWDGRVPQSWLVFVTRNFTRTAARNSLAQVLGLELL